MADYLVELGLVAPDARASLVAAAIASPVVLRELTDLCRNLEEVTGELSATEVGAFLRGVLAGDDTLRPGDFAAAEDPLLAEAEARGLLPPGCDARAAFADPRVRKAVAAALAAFDVTATQPGGEPGDN